MTNKPEKLTANPLWKEGCALADYMYGKLDQDFRKFPDEKWNTERKMRSSANDLIFDIAQAIGNTTPDNTEYDWSNARKHLFALQTMYIFAGKQHFLELEPEIVVRIENLLAKIDGEITTTRQKSQEKSLKDMEPWLEKYDIWKRMQDK